MMSWLVAIGGKKLFLESILEIENLTLGCRLETPLVHMIGYNATLT